MVRYRFDDKPPVETLGYFVDNMIGFRRDDKSPNFGRTLINGLIGGVEKMAVETTDINDNTVMMVFDVTGAKAAVEKVNQGCEV